MFDGDERSFDEQPEGVPDPPDTSDLADDEKAILAGEEPEYEDEEDESQPEPRRSGNASTNGSHPARLPDPNKPKKQYRTKKFDSNPDIPIRERVREYAGMGQKERLKFWEEVYENKNHPLALRVKAAEKLDEYAMDKTGVAAPIATNRPGILISRSGSSMRPGGDTIAVVISEERPEPV